MAYVPKVWANDAAGATPILAAELNRIETGNAEALRLSHVPTYWYTTPQGTFSTTVTPVLNDLVFVPLWLAAGSVDRLACRVSTAATAASGAVARLGLYNSTATGLPNSLLVDGGTVSTETAGAREVTVSVTTAGGLFWGAVVMQTATTAMTSGLTSNDSLLGVGQASILTTGFNGYRQTGVTGALPATATPVALTVSPSRVWYRAA